MAEFPYPFLEQQGIEHSAWIALTTELVKLGVGEINAGGKNEKLHDLIVAWGEELSELRRLDPDAAHRISALMERRMKIDRWNEVT